MNTGLELSPLTTYSTREWASWLAHGIRAFFRLTRMPSSFSPSDAFPSAKLYIGANPYDLAADLIDVQRDLPAPAQGRFEEAVTLVWAELDFDRAEHYVIALTILSMARRGRIRAIVEVLPASLPRLRYALRRSDLLDAAAELRVAMFAAVVDLAAPTPRSASAIRALLDAQSLDPKFHFATGMQALSGLARLCRGVPNEVEGWIALFARSIGDGLDLKERATARFVHDALADACEGDRLDEAINRMRGLAATDTSPTDGCVTLAHWIEADAFLAAIAPLSQPSKRAQNALPTKQLMSVSYVAGILNIE